MQTSSFFSAQSIVAQLGLGNEYLRRYCRYDRENMVSKTIPQRQASRRRLKLRAGQIPKFKADANRTIAPTFRSLVLDEQE
jgi:hypothetical protein